MNVLSETKLIVHIDPIDGFHMADYDFECDAFVFENRMVKKRKDELKKDDDDNYVMTLNDAEMRIIGRGRIKVLVTAYIPDADFEDGFRTERELLCERVANV